MSIRINRKWRSVFADADYEQWQCVEICESLLVPINLHQWILKTYLAKYVYAIGGEFFIVLGDGSLYNHSDNHNLNVYFDHRDKKFCFIANQLIREWDELSINYNDLHVQELHEKSGE